MLNLPLFSPPILLGLGIFAATLFPLGARAQTYDTENVIALQGDASPSGGSFFRFFSVALNDAGDVAFGAAVLTESPGISLGVFHQPMGGSLRVVAQDGFAVPGMLGVETLVNPSISSGVRSLNSEGDLVFNSAMRPILPGPATQGFFLDAGGVQTEILRIGDPAPASAGGTLRPVTFPAISDSGKIIFSAIVSGGAVTEGIFAYENGTISPIILAGDASPEAATYASFGDLTINAAGDVVFEARLSDNLLGLFRIVGGVQSTVALIGQIMPDSDSASIYSLGGSPLNELAVSINSAGDVTFGALSNNGLTSTPLVAYEGAYVREISGALRAVAVAGQPAPGTGDGLYDFGPFLPISPLQPFALSVLPRIGDSGAVLFGAPFAGPSVAPSQVGLFVDSAGSDELIFRTGDAAPILAGSTLNSLGFVSGAAQDEHIFRVATNSRNDVAFVSELSGTTSGFGLFYLPEPSFALSLLIGVGVGALGFARTRGTALSNYEA